MRLVAAEESKPCPMAIAGLVAPSKGLAPQCRMTVRSIPYLI
jgi:hypothetical protein